MPRIKTERTLREGSKGQDCPLFEIRLIPVDRVDELWESRIAPRILLALEMLFGEYSIEWIRNEAIEGRLIILEVWSKVSSYPFGLITISIEVYPNGRALNIFSVAGKGLKKWLPYALSTLERIASGEGCKWIKAHGGPRWRDLGRRMGFREHSVFVKSLASGAGRLEIPTCPIG